MKIVSVVGARPQFIKAAPVSDAIRARGHRETLVHTGQHYDYEMSGLHFEQTGLREPDVHLEVGSASHGRQTGVMLEGIEKVLLADAPDWVVVYGDTNSTLAGALAAAKLGIPIAHVEAGLRSYRRSMPEEINRVVTDHLSDICFCPSAQSVANLRAEGITAGVHCVGDVMYDAILHFLPHAERSQSPLERLGLENKPYSLATIHRAENTDDRGRLRLVLECLGAADGTVVFPMHPRTASRLESYKLRLPENVTRLDPVGYLQMLQLVRKAAAVLTDSGGLQKEAFWLAVPCVTLREETEWTETVTAGWNHVVGLDAARVKSALAAPRPASSPPLVYGDGSAAAKMLAVLESAAATPTRVSPMAELKG